MFRDHASFVLIYNEEEIEFKKTSIGSNQKVKFHCAADGCLETTKKVSIIDRCKEGSRGCCHSCHSKRRPLCLLKPKNELPATVHYVLRLGRDSGRSFAEMVASVTDNILPVNIDAVKFWAQLYYNAPPRRTEDPSLSHRLHF